MKSSAQTPDHIWFNGGMVRWEDAKVHVLTHAFNYGTAAFEGLRAYPAGDEMYIFRLQDHIRRLFESAKIYGIRVGYSQEELADACVDVVARNKLHVRAYIRPLAYVANIGIGISFANQPAGVAIAAVPFEDYFAHKDGISVGISSWRRISEQSLPPAAKISGHYTNSVLGKMEALANGFGEAIMLDMSGKVSEGTGENIFVAKDGRLVTPPKGGGILEGITRRTIIELAAEEGIEVVERGLARTELYGCDEAFFVGTAAEVTPITSIDRKTVSDGKPGRITKTMMGLYSKAVVGELSGHRGWVTPVYARRAGVQQTASRKPSHAPGLT
ncbi:MAG: branched-chain amino acid transaminase [Nitrososphaerota archaeon]|nr:branched-chain amino acid transaminase [Nitrososphaerota archaeon]